MENEIYRQIFDEIVSVFRKYNVSPKYGIDFLLYFCAFHARDDIDEEEARICARGFYEIILKVNEAKKENQKK